MPPETWDDSDSDLMALTGRSQSRFSIKAMWPQLLAIAGVTFVAAYYLPMHRAHEALTKQHVVAAQQLGEVGGQLDQTRTKLRAAEEQRKALAARIDAVDAETERQTRAIKAAEERVDTALAKPIKSGAIQVQSAGGSLTLSVDADQIFVRNKLDVTPKGKDLLCDVARALGDGELRVTAPTLPGERPPPALRQAARSPWSLGAMRAAAVADSLTQACKVPTSRIRHVGGSIAAKGAKGAAVSIEVLRSEG